MLQASCAACACGQVSSRSAAPVQSPVSGAFGVRRGARHFGGVCQNQVRARSLRPDLLGMRLLTSPVCCAVGLRDGSEPRLTAQSVGFTVLQFTGPDTTSQSKGELQLAFDVLQVGEAGAGSSRGAALQPDAMSMRSWLLAENTTSVRRPLSLPKHSLIAISLPLNVACVVCWCLGSDCAHGLFRPDRSRQVLAPLTPSTAGAGRHRRRQVPLALLIGCRLASSPPALMW